MTSEPSVVSGKEVVRLLDQLYPKIKTPLSHKGPFQLLISTVLSAQCTDAQVNKVTPVLFKKYPDPDSVAKGRIRDLENIIRSTGYYHVKSRRIKEISMIIVEQYHGKTPDSMEALTSLSGVGRKTANIVLSAGYGKIEGISVDTHVQRLAHRIGLSEETSPDKIEQDLMRITPKALWPRLSLLLILHGRNIFIARKPQCERCVLASSCKYFREKRSAVGS